MIYHMQSYAIFEYFTQNQNWSNVLICVWYLLPGYGKFNYLLLLAVLPGSFSSIFSSSVMSYVLPSAECDLQLTMFDKGLLNSMVFAGGIFNSPNNCITTVYYRCEGARWERQSLASLKCMIIARCTLPVRCRQ